MSTSAPRDTWKKPRRKKSTKESVVSAFLEYPCTSTEGRVDLVLVPVTITDPMNRLVTGLEKENFQLFEGSAKAGDQVFLQ